MEVCAMQVPSTSVLDSIHKEWPVIKAAPYSFFSCLGIIIFLSWLVINWRYRSRINRYKEEIHFLERDVERFEKGGRQPDTKQNFILALLKRIGIVTRHNQNAGQLQAQWRERFDNPKWNVISGRKYENHSLEVDGNSYQDCSFKNVSFIFHGTAPFEFRGNTQLNEGTFLFHSDDPAIHNFDTMKNQFFRLPGVEATTTLRDASGNVISPPRIRVAPSIVKVSDWIEDGTSDPKLGYPLKIRAQFRNDSPVSVSVRMSTYTGNRAPAKEPQPSAVLQIKLDGKWLPAPNAEDHIAVAPTQHFRAWIGLDHKRITARQAEENRGSLGTVALLVDGEIIKFDL
jgi:hypothetical protein